LKTERLDVGGDRLAVIADDQGDAADPSSHREATFRPCPTPANVQPEPAIGVVAHEMPCQPQRTTSASGGPTGSGDSRVTDSAGSVPAALEADLLAVAAARDRAAFARLFAFYAPRVKAYLLRLGCDDTLADDVSQDVMLAIWRRAHQFDPSRAAPSTWVFAIARNKRVDALRRQPRPEFDPDEFRLVAEPEPPPRGDGLAEAEETRRTVLRAVETLPKEQAELVRIFYLQGTPQTEIAAQLQLLLGTVKSRLRLALGKLRAVLGAVR
jgi:RNA polymerase sigma-70 factor (ECF subfamily)